ncbi:DUF2764 family protein [bacterium]|nr:DUF2764 family protein [bacterium]
MMDKFYYTIAQLPTLTFDKKPLLPTIEFLDEAEKWLSAREFSTLMAVDIRRMTPAKGDAGIYRRYQEFDLSFREALAQWRAGRKAGQEIKPFDLPLGLVKDGNPLEIEKKLLRHRWDFLDTQEECHYFDLGFILLYYMKLQILDWIDEFDAQKGLATFQKVSAAAVEHESADVDL